MQMRTRAVTNQCDRLINEEPPIPLRLSAGGPFHSRCVSLPLRAAEQRLPSRTFSSFFPYAGVKRRFLNAHLAGNPDIIGLSKDPNVSRDPSDAGIRGTILTISNGVKFLLPEFETLFETLALLELRRIFPLCVLFHVASSSNIYVHI